MTMTPTPLDTMWLQQQLGAALAAVATEPCTPVPLPRSTVELMVAVLASGTAIPTLARRYNLNAADLRSQTLAELRRLARHEVAPSKGLWDQQRTRQLPTAQYLCRALGVRWMVLCREAGLQINRYALRYGEGADEFAGDGAVTGAKARPDPDAGLDDRGLPTMGTPRVEVDVTPGGVRITREYHTLR